MRINPSLDWSKPNFQSVSLQIIPTSDLFELSRIKNSVWINSSLNWFGFIRIDALDWIGMSRIESDWFLVVFHQTRYKTFFGLVRKQIFDRLGFTRVKFLSDTFTFQANSQKYFPSYSTQIGWNSILLNPI